MAAGLIARGAGALGPMLARFAPRIGPILAGSPALVARVGQRLGRNLNPGKLLQLAKNNKLVTAMILWESGEAGASMLNEMKSADAEVASYIETLGYEPTSVAGTDNVGDIAEFSEEFESIRKAIGVLGSYDRLMAVRQALQLDTPTYLLYKQVKSMASRMA